jgi:hypothetical protein
MRRSTQVHQKGQPTLRLTKRESGHAGVRDFRLVRIQDDGDRALPAAVDNGTMAITTESSAEILALPASC